MASNAKKLVNAFVTFLKDELSSNHLSADSCESLEVAVQCLESAYDLGSSDGAPASEDPLINIYNKYLCENQKAVDKAKGEAEALKNEGNNLMKNEKYLDALDHYTRAIILDANNAVYYCNRAAAYSKLNNHEAAIKECQSALRIDPTYSKAYGRLGLAYSSLNKHAEALTSYKKALELEPENESYQNNLALTEEKLATSGATATPGASAAMTPPFDISMLLNNPTLMNMATQMLSDPAMQNMMSFMGSNVQGGAPGMEALIEAGHQLAQQMQSTNPDLIESLRRQMGPNGERNDDPNKPNNN